MQPWYRSSNAAHYPDSREESKKIFSGKCRRRKISPILHFAV